MGEDRLQDYFEGRRSGGGPVEAVSMVDADRGIAYVTFEKWEDAERVASREHTLDKQQLKVTLHKPPKVMQNCVKVTGIPDFEGQEEFSLFVEKCTQENVEKIRYGDGGAMEEEEEEVAVVFFERDVDVQQVRTTLANKPFKGHNLEVSAVTESGVLLVRDLPPGVKPDRLRDYFESPKRGQAGEVTDVHLKNEDDPGYALVALGDADGCQFCKDYCTLKMHEFTGTSRTASIDLINDKGGAVVIHLNSPCLDFDQIVDGSFRGLLPDKAFLDKKHVRVKPRSGQRPISILDFLCDTFHPLQCILDFSRRVPDTPWNLDSIPFTEVQPVPLEDHQSQGSKNRTKTSSRSLRKIQRHSKTSVGANVTDTTLPFSLQFKGRKDGTALEEGNIPTTVDEKHPIVGVIKKLDTFKREDYIKDTTLIGADPLRPDYPLVHKDWTTGETHGRQFCLQFQDEGHISKRLTEYAKDSELCVWISETLPEYFDLPVTTKPPKDVVQAFLAGVNLPIILLTVCQDVEKAREYANETASALKWRVLDFCHLDFLLLPCVVPNNFDLNDLEDEIKKQQQKLSWCHGGPTRLDENTFPTMKAATNALAGSTSVPCLLEDNGPEEMETLVMEEEWRDLMLRRIDELNPPGGHGHTLRVNLDPVVPFKEKVAEIEAMKRMSVRNLVTVVIPTPDSKLDACIRRLKQEVFDRYGVNLQIKVTTEVQEGSLQETTRAGDQTSDEAASDQTPIPSVPMSLIQGTKSLVLTNRG